MKKQAFNKSSFKTVAITTIAGLFGILGLWLVNVIAPSPNSANAASAQQLVSNCINSSNVPNVQSIKDACNLCYTSGSSVARGALWITSDNTGNSDIVYANALEGTVTAHIFGKTYACRQTTSNKQGAVNKAYYYWFGSQNSSKGDSTKGTLEGKVDFIEENTGAKSLYRGYLAYGQTGVWYSTQNDNYQDIHINVEKFIKYVRSTNPGGVYEPEDGNYRYTGQVSVNRCFKDIGGYKNPHSSGACYGTNSTIILEVKVEHEPEPEEPEPTVEEAGRIRFISRSTVHTDKQQDIDNHTETSDDKGADTVKMFLSTDESKANVQFWHEMRYLRESNNGGPIEPIGGRDRFKNGEYIKTEWTIRRSSNERSDANTDVESGTFRFETGSPNGIPFKAAGNRHTYTINDIQPGETVEVCEKITFHNVIFPLQREEVKKKVNVYEPTGTDIGQGVFIMTPTEDTSASNVGVTTGGQLGIFRSASSSDYYHYEQRWVPDQWGGGYWESVEAPGGKIGESIYARDPGVTLYTYAFEGIGEYTGQSVYAWKNGEENLGHDNIRYYNYVGSDSPHHWNYEGQLVSGPDEWGYAVSSDGGSLMVRRQDEIHDYWLYSPIEGADYDDGNGWSEACISVTRPKEPAKPSSTPDPDLGLISGPVSGSPDEGFMYAGEDTEARWSVGAIGYATRRIMQAKAIVYQPTVNTQARDDISKGNMENYKEMQKNRDDPCAWYRKKVSNGGGELRNNACAEITEASEYYGSQGFFGVPFSPKHIENQANIVIPNEVGDKLCNSFGFEFSYWYGVTHSNPATESWREEGRRYWANYDAACRTIVKKPSLNIWNGSLFTNGDIATTIANRYNNPYLGATDLYMTDRKIFGSWAEYLAVPYGEVKSSKMGGFGSGATLGYSGLANGNTTNLLRSISPLTIANNNVRYGNSGITSGSTYRARLSTYLGNDDVVTSSNIYDAYGDNHETKIIRVSGNLKIEQDIKLVGTYASVYDLPQIIIIADGDIEIAPDVTRIDAWLISNNGQLKTCDGFVKGEAIAGQQGTEALVKDHRKPGDTRCSGELTINGPVIAKNIVLKRSAGSDPINYSDASQLGSGADAKALPGEVLNLGADAYLWSYAQAGRYDSSFSESYIRELPPRY